MEEKDFHQNLPVGEKRKRNDDRGPEQLPRSGSQQGEPQEPVGEPVFPGGRRTDASLNLTDGNQPAEERLRAAAAEGQGRQDQSDAESDTQEQDADEPQRKSAQLIGSPQKAPQAG